MGRLAAVINPQELQVAPTEVVIPITGIRAMPELRIAPATIGFGNSELGELTIKPVTLTNIGGVPVEFNAYRLMGSNDFSFSSFKVI